MNVKEQKKMEEEIGKSVMKLQSELGARHSEVSAAFINFIVLSKLCDVIKCSQGLAMVEHHFKSIIEELKKG